MTNGRDDEHTEYEDGYDDGYADGSNAADDDEPVNGAGVVSAGRIHTHAASPFDSTLDLLVRMLHVERNSRLQTWEVWQEAEADLRKCRDAATAQLKQFNKDRQAYLSEVRDMKNEHDKLKGDHRIAIADQRREHARELRKLQGDIVDVRTKLTAQYNRALKLVPKVRLKKLKLTEKD